MGLLALWGDSVKMCGVWESFPDPIYGVGCFALVSKHLAEKNDDAMAKAISMTDPFQGYFDISAMCAGYVVETWPE